MPTSMPMSTPLTLTITLTHLYKIREQRAHHEEEEHEGLAQPTKLVLKEGEAALTLERAR